jgi:hypothetical protein
MLATIQGFRFAEAIETSGDSIPENWLPLPAVTQKGKTMKRSLAVLSLVGLGAVVSAHPHFNKTITADLGGVQAVVTYNTTPANEGRATAAPIGVFTTPRGPRLKLSADLKSGDKVVVPAGEYLIGVIKNSETDWTMALYNGTIARGAAPDPTKVLKLDSMFDPKVAPADHMLIDITPGHGKFLGKAVLTLHFGSLFLSGLLGYDAVTTPAAPAATPVTK